MTTKDRAVGDEGLAVEPFSQGLYCAESVLAVIARENDAQSPLIPGIATGLCSGMARTCGTCGALSGGVLALGMITGRAVAEQSVEPTYDLAAKLVRRFEAEFRSTNCVELLGCDIGTAEGQLAFAAQNLEERCKTYTRRSISIVRELLADTAG